MDRLFYSLSGLVLLGILGLYLKTMTVDAEDNPVDVYGTEYAVINYEGVGTLAVKALFDEQGEVHVLTCFQREGEDTSRCWSKNVSEVE